MNRQLPQPNQLLAWMVVLLALSGVLLGAMRPMGHRPVQNLQTWWTLRRFHQAEVDQDLPALLDLGRAHLLHTGRGDVLEFAAYRVGYSASAPSFARLPEDALYWAEAGASALAKVQDQLPDPWTSLQTQAYILVERVFPLSHREQDLETALQAMEDRLAAGGGLHPATLGLQNLYIRFLETPKSERNIFLLKHLERDDLSEGQ
ncbi:MAG: hypothetical protein ACYSU1_01565 [Planctomycetota bacterium]|jgi:hypothetical protein